MALDHGQFEQVATGIGDSLCVRDRRFVRGGPGYDLVWDDLNDADVVALCRNAKLKARPRDAQRHRQRRQPQGPVVGEQFAILRHQLPVPEDQAGPRRPEVVERDQVRAPARGDRPAVAQPKVFGRVEAGQLERQEWVQTQDDRLPDHGVDMTLVQQGDRRPVVGAEDKAP